MVVDDSKTKTELKFWLKNGYNFNKMQSIVMELAPVVATMMSDNNVKFQSSTLNVCGEKKWNLVTLFQL